MEKNYHSAVTRRSEDLNDRAVQSTVTSSAADITSDTIAEHSFSHFVTKPAPALQDHLITKPSIPRLAKGRNALTPKIGPTSPESSTSVMDAEILPIGYRAEHRIYPHRDIRSRKVNAYNNFDNDNFDNENFENDFVASDNESKPDSWSVATDDEGQIVIPPIELPEEYYVDYEQFGSPEWHKYGILTQTAKDYFSGGINSAFALECLLSQYNYCPPVDFKILLPESIEAATDESASNAEDRKDHFESYVPASSTCPAQQQSVCNESDSGYQLSQTTEKEMEKGESAESCKKLHGDLVQVDTEINPKSRIAAKFPGVADFQPYSAKPKEKSMPEINRKIQNFVNNVAHSSHSVDSYKFVCAGPAAEQERSMSQTIHDHSMMDESRESIDQNSQMGKTMSPRKKTYADTVQMPARQVQYRKWLDTNFPCISTSPSPTMANVPEEDREQEDKTLPLYDNESLFVHSYDGEKTLKEGSPVKPIHSNFTRPNSDEKYTDIVRKTASEIQLGDWLDSASISPRVKCTSYSNKVKEMLMKEQNLRRNPNTDNNQEFFNSDDPGKLLGAGHITRQGINLSQNIYHKDPTDMSPEEIDYLLRVEIELPYNPRRLAKDEMPYNLRASKTADQKSRQNTNLRVKTHRNSSYARSKPV